MTTNNNKKIVKFSDYSHLYYNRGWDSYNSAKYDDAIFYLRQAEKLGCKKNDLFQFISHIYAANLEDYKNSFNYVTKALFCNKKSGYNYFILGANCYMLKEYNKSLYYLKKAELLGYKTYGMLIKMARMYKNNNDIENALKYVNKVLLMDITNSYNYYYKGWIYYDLNQYQDAFIWYKKAEKLGYKEAFFYSELSYIYSVYKKDNKMAMKYINMALLKDSTDSYNYFFKGCIYLDLNQFDKAFVWFKKAEKLGYNNVNLLNYLMELYVIHKKDKKMALKYADKALLMDNKNSYNYLNKGLIFLFFRQVNKAHMWLKKSEELGCKDKGLFSAFSLTYYFAKKDKKMAMKYINMAISLDNKCSEFCFFKSLFYYYEAKYNKAFLWSKKAEKLGYENEGLFILLAYIYIKKNDCKNALEYINKAILNNNNLINNIIKTYIFCKFGKFDEAITYLKEIKNTNNNLLVNLGISFIHQLVYLISYFHNLFRQHYDYFPNIFVEKLYLNLETSIMSIISNAL